MFVLDTNTLGYFFRGDGDVGRRLLLQRPDTIAVPAIVVYELETGIAKSSSPKKRRKQLDTLLSSVQLLPFGREEAASAGAIRAALERAGTPIGPMDLLIAATALCRGAVLVTRNLSEFQRVPGLRVEDWYGR